MNRMTRLHSRSLHRTLLAALLSPIAVFGAACTADDAAPSSAVEAPAPGASAVDGGGGPSEAATEASSVDAMLAALGGREAIVAATTEVVTSTSQRFDPGEAANPGTTRLVSDITLTESTSLAAKQSRAEFAIKTHFPGPADLTFTEVRDGTGGYVSGLDNVFAVGTTPPPAALPGARVTAADKHSDLFSVLRLIRASLGAGGALADDGTTTLDGKSVRVVKASTSNREPIRLLLDSTSSLPVRAITVENHPPLGDTLVEVAFDDYRAAGPLKLPFKATLSFDGKVTQVETRSAIAIDSLLGADTFAFPASITARPSDTAALAFGNRSGEWLRSFGDFGIPLFYELQSAGSTPEVLAPGVTLIKGPSHHSLLIEMSDHLVVVEAPLYEEWTANVLATIKNVSPKPLKKIVLSHFHFDHSGGVRELAAEVGTTVYAPSNTTSFFDDVFSRPHALHPDRYATLKAARPKIEGVASTTQLTDGAGRIVELRLIPNSHVDGMLAVYLPAEKILFEADLYSPGFPTNSPVLAGELYDAIIGQGLSVDRIVGAHGFGAGGSAGVTSVADLKMAAGR